MGDGEWQGVEVERDTYNIICEIYSGLGRPVGNVHLLDVSYVMNTLIGKYRERLKQMFSHVNSDLLWNEMDCFERMDDDKYILMPEVIDFIAECIQCENVIRITQGEMFYLFEVPREISIEDFCTIVSGKKIYNPAQMDYMVRLAYERINAPTHVGNKEKLIKKTIAQAHWLEWTTYIRYAYECALKIELCKK